MVGLILCAYLNFIVIVLEPFDTSQFEAEHKTALLSGYGFMIFVVFFIQSCIENSWYFRLGKVWRIRHEAISTIVFCFFAGTTLYLYNIYGVNEGLTVAMGSYMRFFCVTVAGMIPVFFPPMIYLRQKFGERIVPLPVNSVVLVGENKNEVLHLKKDELLFVGAIENYVEICFTQNGSVASKTFRQTLSNVHRQLPFLEQCHRSFLVNFGNIKAISGNSQGAKIVFDVGEKEIPLSKTYYKNIKGRMVQDRA